MSSLKWNKYDITKVLRRWQRGFRSSPWAFPQDDLPNPLAIYPDFPPSKVAKLSFGSKRCCSSETYEKKNLIFLTFRLTSKFSFKVSGTSENFCQKVSTKKKSSNFDETRIFINSKRFQEKKNSAKQNVD